MANRETVACMLPAGSATAVAATAERRGGAVAPGPVFAPEGGFARYLRLPWTRPGEGLEEAVRRLAAAWRELPDRRGATRRGRAMVA